MEFGPLHTSETTVESLPVERVPEFVPCRRAPVGRCVNSGRPDELLPSGEFVAHFFNRGRGLVQHRGHRPHREVFAHHAAALQNAPLFRVELFQLDLQHLL